MPSAGEFLLPQRAYLLSYREQGLPARRSALQDSHAHFEAVADVGSPHEAQLGLLGLIGDAMQVVEDVGTIASAMMTGFPGLPFYVAATVYRSSDVNNFYAGIHKRDHDYFMRVCGYRFEGFEVRDFFAFEPPYTEAELAAFVAAEEASAKLVAEHLSTLAREWERYRRFFHAYKHGALLANPDDVQCVEEDEEETELEGMVVWRRRTDEAEIGSHTLTPPREIAEHIAPVGRLALDMAKFIVDTRIAVFDGIEFGADDSVSSKPLTTTPWQFWMRREDIGEANLELLAGRGVALSKD